MKLGRSVDHEEYGRLDLIEIDTPVRVKFETAELQALCPAVENIQPDIYRLTVEFTAQTHFIESKSIKLWLTTFRERKIFAEHLALEIKNHIVSLAPAISDVSVTLVQNIRGGIIETVQV